MQTNSTPPLAPAAQQPARLAVLIDAENAQAAQAEQVMALVAQHGKPIVRRAYGDWTTTQLTPWKPVLYALAIRPCQQFRYRRSKNSTDSALIMDAMDLLHARNVDGFCIVSSDSDFRGLAGRIREEGMAVYGLGRRDTVPAYVAAFDAFWFLDEMAA